MRIGTAEPMTFEKLLIQCKIIMIQRLWEKRRYNPCKIHRMSSLCPRLKALSEV